MKPNITQVLGFVPQMPLASTGGTLRSSDACGKPQSVYGGSLRSDFSLQRSGSPTYVEVEF
ncbi:MAG: hypothetical protein V7K41_30755 [Nostoc sp.]|uniref:hypothetical protein n=1 Tax=Nostoc sp. TaxID=1180 RepID=UPI002FF99035